MKVQKYLHSFQQLANKHAPLLKIGIGNIAPLSHQHLSYQAAKTAISSLFSNDTLAIFDNLDLKIFWGNITENTKNFFLDRI